MHLASEPLTSAPAGKQDGEEHDAGRLRLPCHINFLNMLLFGNGKYWGIPLLLQGTVCGYSMWFAVRRFTADGPDAWYDLSIFVEGAVNAHFGYMFCRSRQIAQLIITHGSVDPRRGRVATPDALRALSVCGWCAVAATSVIVATRALSYAFGDDQLVQPNPTAVFVDAFANAMGYLPVFCLCAWWAWTNWLFWRAGRNLVAHGLTACSVADGNANTSIFGLLGTMRSSSNVWAVNHAVRAITTTMAAEAELQLAGRKIGTSDTVEYSIAAVLFLIVLATAAAPGFVTSDFEGQVQRQLASVALDDPVRRLDYDSQPNKDTPTALMQRLAASRHCTGMNFAGVPMTVQKALAVGTAIFYLVRYFPAL
jgi:hypothetical protein